MPQLASCADNAPCLRLTAGTALPTMHKKKKEGVLDEQQEQNAALPDGERDLQAREGAPAPAPRREPSMRQVAVQIATHLGISEDEALVARTWQIVWEMGRTQAQALCTEALEDGEIGIQGGQTPSERFFRLVKTKGVKKERPWLYNQREPSQGKSAQSYSGQLQPREVARMIAAQLGEQQQSSAWQTIYRAVKALGVEVALVLLEKTHEVEASGGMLVPDASRRRTPGGVYFWLIRQEATEEQHRAIFMYAGPRSPNSGKPTPTPPSAKKKKAKRPPPQSVASLLWEERVLAREEAEAERGEVKSVKITLVGRPGKIVEEGRCVVVAMQQAAKLPPLPAGLPLPPMGQVEATRYSVYIANKQWKKVAEAIKDEEDILIIEGLPVLDGERITVLASNVTTRNLQKAAKAPKLQKARDTKAPEPEATGQTDRAQ